MKPCIALFHWLVPNHDCWLGTTRKVLNSHQTLFLVRGWGLGMWEGGVWAHERVRGWGLSARLDFYVCSIAFFWVFRNLTWVFQKELQLGLPELTFGLLELHSGQPLGFPELHLGLLELHLGRSELHWGHPELGLCLAELHLWRCCRSGLGSTTRCRF